MANSEHLQLLQQGVEAWNAWRRQHRNIRPDLNGADFVEGFAFPGVTLARIDLARADLTGAILKWVHLPWAILAEADLTGANLYRANLHTAMLAGANLQGAIFEEANLSAAILGEADLRRAIFDGANLTGADLCMGYLNKTFFTNTNLTDVRSLETCIHEGPSTLDHRTLAQSGPLPLAFLRGCGLPDALIEYLPTLLNEPFQFYSCFISYASPDQAFAKRLYADLQNKSVRCWYAPEDMKIGDEFRSRIDTSIQLHDRLLLILSEHSIKSRWVQKEVETAFEKEAKENRLVLFPIRVDDAVMDINIGWVADIRRQRHIGDFTLWKEHDAYQQAFARLLRDLTAVARQPEG